jgi:hypothetical protein
MTQRTTKVSLRELFAQVGRWPEDLPAAGGDALVRPGGALDVLSGVDAARWIATDGLDGHSGQAVLAGSARGAPVFPRHERRRWGDWLPRSCPVCGAWERGGHRDRGSIAAGTMIEAYKRILVSMDSTTGSVGRVVRQHAPILCRCLEGTQRARSGGLPRTLLGLNRRVDPDDVFDTAAHHLGQRDLALASDPLRLLVEAVRELDLCLDHAGRLPSCRKRHQQKGLAFCHGKRQAPALCEQKTGQEPVVGRAEERSPTDGRTQPLKCWAAFVGPTLAMADSSSECSAGSSASGGRRSASAIERRS